MLPWPIANLRLSLYGLFGVKVCALLGVWAEHNGYCVNLLPSANVKQQSFATLIANK